MLFARAVDAIKTPPPSASQTPLVEKKESAAFGNYVGLTLSKLTPVQFRRAKKRISDVLYEMEEKDEIEQARCSLPENASEYALRQYPSRNQCKF